MNVQQAGHIIKRRLALLEALRDSKYQQIIGRLRRGDCFCVGGVMCDVHHKISKRGKWVETNEHGMNGEKLYAYAVRESTYGHTEGAVPKQVREYFGLNEVTGSSERPITDRLMDHNDANGLDHWSFERCANELETYFKQHAPEVTI